MKSALAPQIPVEGDMQGVEYGTSMSLTKPGALSLLGQTKSEVSGWNVKTAPNKLKESMIILQKKA